MEYAAVDQWFDNPVPIVGGTGPYTLTLVSGYLPTGLALESDGTVEGYALFPQDATFTVQITDSSSPAETLTTSIGLEAFAEPFSPSTGSAGIPEVVQADDLLLPLTQQIGPEAVQLHDDTGGGGQEPHRHGTAGSGERGVLQRRVARHLERAGPGRAATLLRDLAMR